MQLFSAALAGILGLGICLPSVAQDIRKPWWGSPASVTQAERTVTLGPDTRWVNVLPGETIRFVGGATEFAWRFDGPADRSFDLRQAAPAGALTRSVTAYVGRHPGRRAD